VKIPKSLLASPSSSMLASESSSPCGGLTIEKIIKFFKKLFNRKNG
jgi:hypothetical protein